MTTLPAVMTVSEIQTIAVQMAKSGLFGFKKPEEGFSLMMIAQAEGKHPAIAARDYHIISGRPTLKADAMLARFLEAGGRVEWRELNDTRVCAKFSHPQGGSVEIDWDIKRAKAAGLGGRDMWTKYPRQMLRSRVVSEGIRTVCPGVLVGTYEEEEVRDFVTPSEQNSNILDATFEVEDEVKNAAHQWLSSVKADLKEISSFDEFDNYVMGNMKEIEEGVFTSKSHEISDEQIKWLNNQLEGVRTRLYKAAAKTTDTQNYEPSTLMAG